jgi:hypothetical protein
MCHDERREGKAQSKEKNGDGGGSPNLEPYGFFIEDMFCHSSAKLVKGKWVWVPKGQTMFPHLGFPTTKQEIVMYGGAAVKI